MINPEEPIDASWIHGITDDMVVGAPTFSDVVPLMRELLDGAILTAHNAPFEVRFLNAELSRLDGSWGGRRLCTMSLARKLHPGRKGPGSSKLVNLAEFYELSGYESHRALADVITTTMLLCRMLESKKAEHDIGAVLKKVIKPVKEPVLWPDVGPVTGNPAD